MRYHIFNIRDELESLLFKTVIIGREYVAPKYQPGLFIKSKSEHKIDVKLEYINPFMELFNSKYIYFISFVKFTTNYVYNNIMYNTNALVSLPSAIGKRKTYIITNKFIYNRTVEIDYRLYDIYKFIDFKNLKNTQWFENILKKLYLKYEKILTEENIKLNQFLQENLKSD